MRMLGMRQFTGEVIAKVADLLVEDVDKLSAKVNTGRQKSRRVLS